MQFKNSGALACIASKFLKSVCINYVKVHGV